MATRRYALNQTFAKSAPAPADGRTQALYFDDRLHGFGLRVAAGGKRTYFAEGVVNGKTRRVTVGPALLVTCEKARTMAMGMLASMKVDGRDLLEEERRARAQAEQNAQAAITVRLALESRLESNKRLKASTKAIYRYELKTYLGDWLDLPLRQITRDQVLQKHAELSKRSKSKADSVMKALGTLYPYVRKVHQLPVDSPVTILYDAKAWNGSVPRAKPIPESRLHKFWEALSGLANGDGATQKQSTFGEMLWFILFTGLRRNEAAQLSWDRVDLESETITINDTKNGQRHVLPLSPLLVSWLGDRRKHVSSEYVFPGTSASKHGYITGIAELLEKLRKAAGSGFEAFSPHDLRATFATVAERCGVNTYTLKRLLNHKPSDITGIVYVQPSEGDLKEAMQLISARLLSSLSRGSNVVPLRA